MNYPTWSDLNNESLVPPLGARQAPDLASVAVMVSCEPDLRYIKSTIGKTDSKPFFNSTLFTQNESKKGICVAGPYIGSPYAVMLLESLIAKGAEKIIVLGWCGSLGETMEPGTLIVPDSSIINEGTSVHYKNIETDFSESKPSINLNNELKNYLIKSDTKFLEESIWTTDAIYRETKKKALWFNEKGAKAVEMECSALFSVAEYRKVEIVALLIVSDALIINEDKTGEWEPGFRNKNFKMMRKKACDAIIGFAGELSLNG